MSKILCISQVDHLPMVYNKLHQLGELHYYPDVSKSEAVGLIQQIKPDALFVNPNKLGFVVDRSLLDSSLSVVCTASTGTDHIDLEEASRLSIKVVSITKELETLDHIPSTAELALGLTLSIVRNIPSSMRSVENMQWDCMPYLGQQLCDMKVGVVGYGRLGKMFARFCKPLFKSIYVADPFVASPYVNVPLEILIKECDVISIHIHLTKETRHLFDRCVLSNFKRRSYLVNTARGGIVDEQSVVWALSEGILAGYATDVLEDELGDIKNSPIVNAMSSQNIIVTPHLGGTTVGAQNLAYMRACEMLERVL